MRLIDADALKWIISARFDEFKNAVFDDITARPIVNEQFYQVVKQILLALHNAGGRSADPGTWEQGYYDGISTAIEIVTRATGVSIEEAQQEGDSA